MFKKIRVHFFCDSALKHKRETNNNTESGAFIAETQEFAPSDQSSGTFLTEDS